MKYFFLTAIILVLGAAADEQDFLKMEMKKAELMKERAALAIKFLDIEFQIKPYILSEGADRYKTKINSGKISRKSFSIFKKKVQEDYKSNFKKLIKLETYAYIKWGKNKKEGKENKLDSTPKTYEGEILKIRVKSDKLAVLLDTSASMEKYLPQLKKEILFNFPKAALVEVNNSKIIFKKFSGVKKNKFDKTANMGMYYRNFENPFHPVNKGTSIKDYPNHKNIRHDNYNALIALIENSKVDTIYWLTDLNDSIAANALKTIAESLKKHNVKLHIRSVGREPDRRLKAIVSDSGGTIMVK